MNLNAARNAPVDKQGRKLKVEMGATLNSVNPAITFTPKGAKKYDIEIRDGNNEVSKVTIYPGNSPVLEQFHVGQFLNFKLSAKAGQGKGTGKWYYQGFWDCPNPQEIQQPPQGYQQPPQAPYTPPQATNYQQPAPSTPSAATGEPQRNMTYAYEAAPHVQASIQRSVALEAASRMMIGRQQCTVEDVLKIAIPLWDWLATGNLPSSAVPEPSREPGEDDREDDFENFQPAR